MSLTEELTNEVDPSELPSKMEEFSGCDVCGENHETDSCPILSSGKKVRDTAAPSRARLTLPKNLEVKDLADGSTTVISKDTIAVSTQFGPFEAKFTTEFNLATRFQLKIFDKEGQFTYLDAVEEKDCNWMCLVASAVTEEEMNLIAYQLKQDIYFSAIKTIEPGTELKVWYAPHYGKKMSIPAPWEPGGQVSLPKILVKPKRKTDLTFRLSSDKYGQKRRHKTTKHRMKRSRYYDDNSDDDMESEQTRKEVIKALDPRRLGFKEIRDWKCSQCGATFQNCLDFARHLSDHYKPRPPGAKRRDAGIKRPKNYPCEICGQKFTTERLRHRHKIRHHQRVLRKLRNCQVILQDLKHSRNNEDSEVVNLELKLDNSCLEAGDDIMRAEKTLHAEIICTDGPFPKGDIGLPLTTEIELKQPCGTDVKLQEVANFLSNGSRMQKFSASQLQNNGLITIEASSVTTGSPMNASEMSSLETVIQDIMTSDKGSSNVDCQENIQIVDSNDDKSSNAVTSEVENGYLTEDVDYDEPDGKSGNYECDICHKKFEKSIYLFRHIRKHTGDFICLQCHKVFARKESMLKHQCPGLISENGALGYDFKCTYCDKSFGNDRLLKRHLAKHTGEFTCQDCRKSYTSKDILMNHSCSKNPVTERYACEICRKTFTKLKYLDKHIPVHTGIFSCPICGKWLRSNDSLINHMRICGQVKELEANGTATCPHCKEEFIDLKSFRRHMYDHTHMFACESCGARFRNKLSLGLHVCSAERIMPCDECGKMFNSIASLNRHRLTHGEPEFQCNSCGRSYHRKETLLKHPCEKAKRTRGRISKKPPSLLPLICEICGSLFSSTSSLNVHKNLHGEKRFACEICGKRFHRKDLLIEHTAVHGQPEIPCPVCSKLFKTKKSLDVHLLIHDGIKRFKCQTCGKMFYQKGNLQKHEETHTPGRKHTCAHCNKSFSSKEYLTIHVLEHTRGRIYACHTCGRSFVKEHQLKAHRRIFHGNQAYICKYCGLSVKLRHSLKRHLEKKHASVRNDWDSNEQIAAMLMKQVGEEQEDILVMQNQADTIITEVSPTQGAEVLLAVAGIGSAALQQAIASGTIQQGSVPHTIEISLPMGSEDLQQSILPDEELEQSDDTRTVIQHVVADQEGEIQNSETQHIQISVARGDEESCLPQIVMGGESGQEHMLTDGNTIVLENGTILQNESGNGNPTDLLLYVLTTSETQDN